jgi:hypothetical protein
MTTNAVLLVILSLFVAGGLSFFQYYYKVKNRSKLILFLAFLRFVSIFCVLLLLINPIISRDSTEIVKPSLSIVVDNSSSIVAFNADKTAIEAYTEIVNDKGLLDKFDVQSYRFDGKFQESDKFDFKGKQTNLDLIAKNLKKNNRNKTFPTVIITDGNQTSGNDYVYSFDSSNKVFPIVLGDTTKALDLKINQLNVNKYAFYKNKFPVEVFLQYSGEKNISADFTISQGNSRLVKEKVFFSSSKKTAVINVLLPANKIGSQVFKATISSNESETNTYNNNKNFAVEVMDQKTNIAIISTINHPDVGALKRAIESNEQRKIKVFNPHEIKDLRDYDILIIYQPTAEFKSIFEDNKLAGINTFIITGTNTDFTFLNQQQSSLGFKMSNQKEDYLAEFNPQFNLFALDNIGFENFPPLENSYGTITVNGAVSVLLYSKVRNLKTNSPLMTFGEIQGRRTVFLLGENSWKWRLQSYVENQSFDKFDVFIDKTIQFLASNNSKKSLVVNHESFYNSGEAIQISAQYFNKNYEFDEKSRLSISLLNTENKEVKNYDLLKSDNSYNVNLDGLTPGNYKFSVIELNSKTSYSGRFEILDFDIEKQFVNPDFEKLNQLAAQTKGKMYFPTQVDILIKSLLADEDYKSMEKNNPTRTSLIDWSWLCLFIGLSLAAEWFVRKYNGML